MRSGRRSSADLCLVSGGLGPTHDDRTVELVARVAGRPLRARRGARGADRLGLADDRGPARTAVRWTSRRECASRRRRPEGSLSLGLAGTAPGLVLDLGAMRRRRPAGPPRELQRLWPRALETDAVRRVLAQAPAREHRVLRFFGTPESAVAEALAAAGGDERRRRGDDLRPRVRDPRRPASSIPGAERAALGSRSRCARRSRPYLFGRTRASVAEIVLGLCRERGLTLATAESCTGGMVAARLTAVPGASDVFLGSIVAYANAVKKREPRRAQRRS